MGLNKIIFVVLSSRIYSKQYNEERGLCFVWNPKRWRGFLRALFILTMCDTISYDACNKTVYKIIFYCCYLVYSSKPHFSEEFVRSQLQNSLIILRNLFRSVRNLGIGYLEMHVFSLNDHFFPRNIKNRSGLIPWTFYGTEFEWQP
jgi:hypothetical protein